MGASQIPVLNQEQVISKLLDSIALEITALASVISSEAQKVRIIAGQIKKGNIDNKGLIACHESVLAIIQTACELLILLVFKLEKILEPTEKEPAHNQNQALRRLLQSLAQGENAISDLLSFEKKLIKAVEGQLSGNEYSHFQKNFDSIMQVGEQINILIKSMQKKSAEV